MKLLLVETYPPDRLWSMMGYAQGLAEGVAPLGVEVRRIAPQNHRPAAPTKLQGYVDKFLRFPSVLKRAATEADVVHVVDQGYAMYSRWLKGSRSLLTIHDLMAVRAAQGKIDYWPIGRSGKVLQNWIAASIPAFRSLTFVSCKVAAEAEELFPSTVGRHSVIPNCLFHDFRGKAGKVQAPRPFLHHVGGNQPYKNRLGVLRIAEELFARDGFQDWELRLVGAEPSQDLAERIAASPIRERVRVQSGVKDEELGGIYASSQALLFPSLDEGFGLPILEAQSAGCPVATSRLAPMDEVAGTGAILFDPHDPAGAACALAELPARRQELIHQGHLNLQRFERAEMMKCMKRLYEQVAA